MSVVKSARQIKSIKLKTEIYEPDPLTVKPAKNRIDGYLVKWFIKCGHIFFIGEKNEWHNLVNLNNLQCSTGIVFIWMCTQKTVHHRINAFSMFFCILIWIAFLKHFVKIHKCLNYVLLLLSLLLSLTDIWLHHVIFGSMPFHRVNVWHFLHYELLKKK